MKENRENIVAVRLTNSEKEKLIAVCQFRGMSNSELLRMLIEREYEKIQKPIERF